MVTLRNVLFSASLYTQLSVAQGPCYAVTGKHLSTEYQPCVNLDGAASFCCATNRSIPFGSPITPPSGQYSQDRCLSIGLCEYRHNGDNSYWRPSCTADDFSSSRCVSMCKVCCFTKRDSVLEGSSGKWNCADGLEHTNYRPQWWFAGDALRSWSDYEWHKVVLRFGQHQLLRPWLQRAWIHSCWPFRIISFTICSFVVIHYIFAIQYLITI
jgi:hypothetical protein